MPDLKLPPEYVPGHGLLQGKRVVVTAAAGTGIGFATAKKCAEEGAVVFISDIHDGRLQKAADQLREETGQRPGTTICSVTDQTEVDVLFEEAENAMGGIDVVINNAGLGGTADLVDMTDEQWMTVLDVTLNGCFRINRAAMKYMKKSFKKTGEGGVIVNNASVLGWRAQKGQAHYAAAKAGVMALTRCAGVEGAEFGVRVNAVAPSLALHPFLHKVTSKELLAELEAKEAYGRGSEVWEQANVIVFLASDYSSYMTGEVISTSSQRA
ncbi:MAG: SDR family oxidoreductase [Acidimicrobiales bacterium]|nr:SDR family oxidoreductase [Hyphomonadaceae bacterium]RZV40776.1 MAG: SDR family oxidoreductase [Acidimicrobiales bacterium]